MMLIDFEDVDRHWLSSYNKERKERKSGPVTKHQFELAIDNFEKQWHKLVSCYTFPAFSIILYFLFSLLDSSIDSSRVT
jgi:hypothetical protein